MAARYSALYEIRETAGIHQVYQLEPTDPLQFLDDHYAGALQPVERAA